MDKSLSHNFSLICGELCNLLYVKEYNKAKINSLIDDLNAKPYKAEFFVRKHVSLGYVVESNKDYQPFLP